MRQIITVVSGLPRSGTSLMMQIIEKAGIEVLNDGIRGADESNPKGYLEHMAEKGLMKDNACLKSLFFKFSSDVFKPKKNEPK